LNDSQATSSSAWRHRFEFPSNDIAIAFCRIVHRCSGKAKTEAKELGISETEAYAAAGFRPSRSNAATLEHSQHISERVSELLAEREKVHGQATAVAIKRVTLTKTWVLDKLIENVDRAMQHPTASI
jgi:hypothetical protein